MHLFFILPSTGFLGWQLRAMNSTLFIIGVIGNIISVLVFVSPIPTFWRIVRSRSTEDFEAAPYVLTLLNTLLWLYYGLTKPDGLLIATVNGFGAVMETIYIVLFLVYAADHAKRVCEATRSANRKKKKGHTVYKNNPIVSLDNNLLLYLYIPH
uniref:Protein RUPTURED POLLEN GRAIN 1 n=3 Tax=Aegilops tauschii subsp. strangulata TaxID=200361 RepID=A0A453JMD2_AEGTS